ncbi:hypothetical protein AYO44_06810 [Planctomycetaceae bacterium SCGC AG-212-F19]|nr:hypothetical protein AYO44_06810 [Planctomycetaceae bacterium SCGC AG-212-F19]
MSDATHDALLRGLAAGEESAFVALYDRFGSALFRTALGLIGAREEAEDAVQDVFVGLVQARGRLTEVHDLKAYLFTALRHAAVRLRAQLRKQPLAEVNGLAGPGAPEESSERGVRLEKALQTLPTEQREALVLKVTGGLTFAELAAVLGVGENTVASRYRYALEKLRSALGVKPCGAS